MAKKSNIETEPQKTESLDEIVERYGRLKEEFDYYDAIAGFMDTYAGSVKNAYILGGTAALLPDYFDYVANYLGAPHEVL